MESRLLILLGGLAAIVVALFLAVESMAETDVSEPSTTVSAGPVTASSPQAEAPVQSIAISDAGIVVIGPSEGQLDVRSVRPNPGWVSTGLSVTDRQIRGIFWNLAAAAAYTIELGSDQLEISIKSWQSAGSVEPAVTTVVALDNGPADVTTSAGSATTTRPTSTTATTVPTTSTTTMPLTTTTITTTTTTTSTTTTTTAATATTTTTIPAPDWITVPITSPGGTMVVSYRPGEVELESATPATAFIVGDIDERSNRVEVAFEGADVTYTMRAEWRDGALVTDVDESGDGGD